MQTSILAATDLTPGGADAYARAHELASRLGGRLGLIHVAGAAGEPAPADEAAHPARRSLQDLAARHGPPMPDFLLARGDPCDGILAVAEGRGDDLIVMGAPRPRGLLAGFAGTTAERVIRATSRPVLTVPRAPAGPYARVILATDFSEGSAAAIRRAAALGILAGAELMLAHAYQPLAPRLVVYGGMRTDEMIRESEAEAARLRREMSAFAEALGPDGAPCTRVLIEGLAAESLVDIAGREGIDLIVLGTRGLSGIRRLVLGSVASTVLSRAPCDVLAVPPAD